MTATKFTIDSMSRMAVLVKDRSDTRQDSLVISDAIVNLRNVATHNRVREEAETEGFSFAAWTAFKTAYAESRLGDDH